MKTTTLAWMVCFYMCAVSCTKTETPPKPSAENNSIIETRPHSLAVVSKKVNGVIGGFYSGLPASYDITTKSYPLIIFIHGAGQFGDGSSNIKVLLDNAMPKLLADKKFPSNIKVGAENLSFIMLVPQFSRTPTDVEVKEFVEFAKLNYRVDPARIYMSGLSMGGVASYDYAAAYGSDIAAIVTMSGATTINVASKAASIVSSKIAVWAFHNETDPIFNSVYSRDFISAINANNPLIPARLTIFPVNNSHDSWTTACNPDYREEGRNIYEWMLQYKK